MKWLKVILIVIIFCPNLEASMRPGAGRIYGKVIIKDAGNINFAEIHVILTTPSGAISKLTVNRLDLRLKDKSIVYSSFSFFANQKGKYKLLLSKSDDSKQAIINPIFLTYNSGTIERNLILTRDYKNPNQPFFNVTMR